ncbi:MAG TPA: serine/threonine-protein kinase [Balneolaceae bacterium]|nr:serine/threonine-protein kinase [Balneolaceae bacterium]
MEKQAWTKINEIVDTALELDKHERRDYINRRCGDNKELKKQVTEFLDAIEASDTEDFLKTRVIDFPEILANLSESTSGASASSLIGTTIGNYTLKELVGHGGMGSVFKAERTDQAYDRPVALKLMRRGMDTPSNIARFRRERILLARLDHPNIARLMDGGVTEDGLPYLVMEFIEGKSLLNYCDTHQYSVEERLKLFQSICEAVQHAHENAIIHRDLKPSNILVTGDGQAKILDFGIAKLMEPENPETTLFQTQTGARMLTLGYAAPEQIEHKPATTVTDTYTLGIILYELLAGSHPFDWENKNLTEIEEIIRNKKPKRPSELLARLPEAQQNKISRHRDTHPSELINHLGGDLNAIVMKALRKEPEARYNSAEQLLEDLQRRDNNLPILARDDTLRYNTSKFIQRHIKSMAAVTFFLLCFGIFGALYVINMRQERNKARKEAQKALRVKNLIANIFEQSDPLWQANQNITLQKVINKGAQNISSGLQNQPLVKAELLQVIGNIYNDMGLYDKAGPLLQKSIQLQKERDATATNLYASSLRTLAYQESRTGHFKQAKHLNSRALQILKTMNGLKDNKLMVSIYNDLGLIFNETGNHRKAEMVYKKSLKLSRANNDSSSITITLNNLSSALQAQGKFRQAARLIKKNLNFDLHTYGKMHPSVANDYNNLAFIYQRWGKLQKADSLHQLALGMRLKLLPPHHPQIAESYVRYGLLKIKERQPQKAEKMLIKGYHILSNILPSDHWQVLSAKAGLAISRAMQGNFKENIPILRHVYHSFNSRFGTDDWRTNIARRDLAMLYKMNHKPDKARALLSDGK